MSTKLKYVNLRETNLQRCYKNLRKLLLGIEQPVIIDSGVYEHVIFYVNDAISSERINVKNDTFRIGSRGNPEKINEKNIIETFKKIAKQFKKIDKHDLGDRSFIFERIDKQSEKYYKIIWAS
jgi:hypothetical protein